MMRARELRFCPSIIALALASIAALPPAAGTSTPRPSVPTQEPGSRPTQAPEMVTVRVVLHDKNGQLINNLTREKFRLFEDGKEQQIALFSQMDSQPLNIGLLMQWSAVRRYELPYGEISPASQFFWSVMRNHDAAFVARFSENATLLSDFAEDPALIEESLRRSVSLQLEGQAALYDAIIWACQEKLLPRSGRRILVVVASGIDASGNDGYVRKRRSEALKSVLQTGTAVYFVNLADTNPYIVGNGYGREVAELAKKTGGDIIFVRNQKDMNTVFELIAAGLRNDYVLGYYPINTKRDGKLRKIKIETLDKVIRVQAREGYYAPQK